MAKKEQTTDKYFTPEQKLEYYTARMNDENLSNGERRWAKKRVSEISGKKQRSRSDQAPQAGSKPETKPQRNYSAYPAITDKCCAESAGVGWGAARSNQRIQVDDSVKEDFRNGVKWGKVKKSEKNA